MKREMDDIFLLATKILKLELSEESTQYNRGVCRGLLLAVAMMENKKFSAVLDKAKKIVTGA